MGGVVGPVAASRRPFADTADALCHPPVGARVLLQSAADIGEEPLELQVDKALKKGADGGVTAAAMSAKATTTAITPSPTTPKN
ncbi:unnamed protein product [Vitrella brassicaformis CCMP3155]|uniref:Uncharacterized protein n=1 Tax=Vitrella brassicaformis (strain CCMP3155) TaxID=1169540 RepID=A0A0G4F822_VITBC|nr:unnamed protein product [Vitrella brassicaformis CCMP3155]|eukprot:CEM08863.1 unnamed protein product [Vitrella brassicaformis CCMP3155]